MEKQRILLLGGGGREHALAWKLAQSPEVAHVYVSPGNAGTSLGHNISNVVLNVNLHCEVVKWCENHQVSLVVVGPEDPLATGITDSLTKQGISCFGPSKMAAEIESSKIFAKEFMKRQGIPTARWASFKDYDAATHYINNAPFPALVVKANGLAAGKGVVVASDREEACQAAKQMLQDSRFGTAGSTIVVEEYLEGEEISCLAFSDGKHVFCMPPSQDHKRLLDDDKGPNTGGMGAYCPCSWVTQSDLCTIQKKILEKTIEGMLQEGRPFVGLLYAGLMMTKDGPKVLEYNCRFGDPETQVLMPLLASDLYPILRACCEGRLDMIQPTFHQDRYAVAVVLVSEGYPGSYKKGHKITGVSEVENSANDLVFHAGTSISDGQLVTSGGRVMAAVAVDKVLTVATSKARKISKQIEFEGSFTRSDIAHKALGKTMGLTYSDSGVDISAGDKLVSMIKPLAASTARTGCQPDLGLFGGVFNLPAAGYKEPLLVTGTDGVGTKLKIAQSMESHATIGIDLVAMCVNDILCHAAEPLFFLDYFATGRLNVKAASQVVRGITEGCHLAGCALIGGETAEMPGMYAAEEYDLAGFTVGAVSPEQYLPGKKPVEDGDVLIGVASSGIHSNGFSLVRKVVEKRGLTYKSESPFSTGKSLGDALLQPTEIYVKCLLPLLRSGRIKAAAHITGGGLPGNVCRVLSQDVMTQIDADNWTVPPVFGWLSQQGNITPDEMSRTFNCGLGMVLVTSHSDAKYAVDEIQKCGKSSWIIGSVCDRKEDQDQVVLKNLQHALSSSWSSSDSISAKKIRLENVSSECGTEGLVKRKVGVLISGTGTNLQALIDHTQCPTKHSAAEIVMVISNKADAAGLKRAQQAGIPTKVINHKEFASREAFDRAVSAVLISVGVEIVCLAGFMRIVSGWFVREWNGKLLNIHPSLLPAFKGMHAHQQALKAGVTVTGCTVHFVSEGVDEGGIITQEAVNVLPGDTEDALSERVKIAEHSAFPRALDLIATGDVQMGADGQVVRRK